MFRVGFGPLLGFAAMAMAAYALDLLMGMAAVPAYDLELLMGLGLGQPMVPCAHAGEA